MSTNSYGLPYSEKLDIQTFSRLFDQKTTSYKLIFFYSLLEILRRNFFDASTPISLQELNTEMLVHSWYPHSVFKLSFGYQDTIARKLDKLDIKIDKSLLKITKNDREILRKTIFQKLQSEANKTSSDKDLRRYVPFRLIRPFFPELRGTKDAKVHQAISDLSKSLFESRKPLYKFSEDLKNIVLHPDWAGYFQENYVIIHGWVAWNWISYMQSKNPNSPGIANKIFPPLDEREPLKEQTAYWKAILGSNVNLKCIYSGLLITEDILSLDHYLPWSFVAHNNLWNLIPVPRSVNSSKSNRIPDQYYFDKMIEIQHLGIMESRKLIKESKWKKYMECYLVDLNFESYDEILEFVSFRSKYQSQIAPLISLAESQGFESRWRYRQLP